MEKANFEEAFLYSQLSDGQSDDFEFSDQFAPWEQTIHKLSNYLSEQLANQRQLWTSKIVHFVVADVHQRKREQNQQKKLKNSEDLRNSQEQQIHRWVTYPFIG